MYTNNTTDTERLLTLARQYPTLSTEAVQRLMRHQDIRDRHPYSIYFKPSEGRWVTHYTDPTTGKKRILKRKSEDDLYDALEALYGRCASLSDVYDRWITGMQQDAPSTASRHRSVWRMYLEDTSLAQTPVAQITVNDIKEFFRETAVNHADDPHSQLTRRRAQAVKTLLNLTLDVAVEESLCDDNPSRRIRSIVKMAYVSPDTKHPDEEEVFAPEETVQLCRAALDYYHETDNPVYLAILLASQTGARIGELVALQFGDFADGVLTLRRSEVTRYRIGPDGTQHKDGVEVVPHLKCGKTERRVPLTESAEAILDVLRAHYGGDPAPTDWLFARSDGERHRANDLSKSMTRCCRRAGIPCRSLHKIRKTVISSLLECRTAVTTVRDIAGHSDTRMTLNVYGKSVAPVSKTRTEMEQALPDLSEIAL